MPLTTDIDKVRIRVGDTNEAEPLLYDDEITYLLSANSVVTTSGGTSYNLVGAAADAAGAIAAKFARQFDFSEDGQSFQLAQRAAQYRQLEGELRSRAGGYSHPVGLAGTETI